MAISYRKRGKQQLWDYRIFDSEKKVVASNSGFRTKKEAEIEALEIELKLLRGHIIDNNVSLYELWETWYKLHILPQHKKQATLNKHLKRGALLKEYFGNISIRDIKASSYQHFINEFAKTNGKDNVGRLNSEVKKVIIFAKQDKLDFHDFTIGVKVTGRPSRKREEDKYIHRKADYKRLIEHLENNLAYADRVIYYLLYVQLKTGMRFGEVLGLTWDCISWKNQTIKTYRRYDSSRYVWTDPKTETSVRTVPIDEKTVSVLKGMNYEQSKFNLDNPDNMLFVSPKFGIPTNNGVNKVLQELLETLDIQPHQMTATGIRHTYASIMLSENIDIWALSKIMGHKNITQITETYGHLIYEKSETESNKIRSFFNTLKKG